ncbi:uncharacterized protein Eint_080790 [Encephalitozoon intestinalis ATCC 50506]|uniref:Uncharacterized protein n=1 Tax=Encephalitozoon intestinalis (strain ATCC 50506) TaxID=876142 RepID=E0S8L9_ENCIT|nr:uncharacterized protein Eint_080790 [Encephalitozoon intestinalis ATCC 50506]ADM12013.1 hypothetical protein Eint_080790 [Encephalitozoon intestinalis ATCC 50506]UTX45801.1 hypothetical protein GPK93_08g13780 [Encephalitozoon intestinalis]
MTYVRWLNGEEEWLIRRSRKRSSSRGSQRTMKAKSLITVANNLYVRNELGKCVEVLKETICLVPRNPHPYFTLGLIFEERGEIPKAYYCFFVAAHLQRNNYGLWRKLYDYSRQLGYNRERIYFIEVLQRKGNKREMVVEKMGLYSGDKVKELSCKIELFEFDGVDDGIFDAIRGAITHKARLARLAKRLLNHLTKDESSCSDYYVKQLVILKYEASDFIGMKTMFDKYLFKRRVELCTKLRVIYIMACLQDGGGSGTEECIGLFLEDDRLWSEIGEIDLLKHLADILIEHGKTDEVIKLLGRIRNKFNDQKEFVYWKLGRMLHDKENYDEALLYYRLVLEINPINDDVKSRMHSIYTKQGNHEMAKKYETIAQLIGIVDERNKKGCAYSPEMCMSIRALYEEARTIGDDCRKFIESNGVLVDDFLKNRFIFEKRKKRPSGSIKLYRQRYIGNGISSEGRGEDRIMKEGCREGFRFGDLHGLSVDEWFNVVLSQIVGLLSVSRNEEAMSLVFRSLEAYIFRHRSDIICKLVFVGLKASLMFGDFGDFVTLVRSVICHTGNYSYAYLLFYFSNFFMCFQRNNDFSYFQKYLQRVCRRRLRILPNLGEDLSSESCGDSSESRSINDEGHKEETCENAHKEDATRRRAIGVSHFLFLNSHIPNLLQSKTVEMMSSLQMERNTSESIILASMFLIHSKSRRVSDRNMFIRKGISILKSLKEKTQGEDGCVVSYNIGKAYQFFGFPGLAESFYMEALGTSDVELRRLVQFNLYLIYKKNNTMELFKDILKSKEPSFAE